MDSVEKDRRTAVMRKRVMGGQYMTSLEALVCTSLNAVDAWYQFHQVVGRYTADFLVPGARLVVEADGTYWHSREGAAEHDDARDGYMAEHGYRVLRIPDSATQAEIVAMLRDALDLGPDAAYPTGRA
jgi:very-short-patch-repair endonuclease